MKWQPSLQYTMLSRSSSFHQLRLLSPGLFELGQRVYRLSPCQALRVRGNLMKSSLLSMLFLWQPKSNWKLPARIGHTGLCFPVVMKGEGTPFSTALSSMVRGTWIPFPISATLEASTKVGTMNPSHCCLSS